MKLFIIDFLSKNKRCANLTVKIVIKENLKLENCIFLTGFYGLGATGCK